MHNPLILKDYYKVGHIHQYPRGTNLIFSNFTPRKSRMPGVQHSVFFGLRYFIFEYLKRAFDEHVFKYNDDFSARDSAQKYTDIMRMTLGWLPFAQHIEDLYKLGYLPIAIYALPEGTEVPCGCPAMVMYNTHPDFYWLPGMLETLLSCTLWGACTSATIAKEYRKLLDHYAELTSDDRDFVDYQAHDFSFRGMSSVESAVISGMAHLQYFKGTDCIPALFAAHNYYGRPLGIASVPATEHSVMSAGGREQEYETYKRLITEVYPNGIISVVSDTWDLWRVVGEYLPRLKDSIMARNGKVVIRPDSGDPIEILCGQKWDCFETHEDALAWADDEMSNQAGNDCEGSYNCGNYEYFRRYKIKGRYYEIRMTFDYDRHDKRYYYISHSNLEEPKEIFVDPKNKGLIELLWEIFGGTVNSKGYKQLDPHIGAIYGDSITLDRARDICERLMSKGFASTNIVFGVGSFTYQYNTRDTLGWAMKATYIEILGEGRAISKDPITDDGTKKSASGILKVIRDSAGHYQLLQNQTWEQFHESNNELKLVFKDGNIIYRCQGFRESTS